MKNDLKKLQALSPSGYEFFLKTEKEDVALGRHELEGGAYANVMAYESKVSGTYEAHKAYIDVQIILSGREVIGVETLEVMHAHECVRPYDEAADIEVYAGNDDGTSVLLEKGDFLILMPTDAHMPGIAAEGKPTPVKKAVIKIPVA